MSAVTQVFGNFGREAPLFEEFGQGVRDFVEIFPFDFTAVFAFSDMANRHRDDDAVGNQVAEIQLALDFGFGWERSILLVVVVDKFKDIPVELFFGTDQRLDASLEREVMEGFLLEEDLR